jgi:hypothetical protein
MNVGKGDSEVWLKWARKNLLHPSILAFIKSASANTDETPVSFTFDELHLISEITDALAPSYGGTLRDDMIEAIGEEDRPEEVDKLLESIFYKVTPWLEVISKRNLEKENELLDQDEG